MAEAARKYGPGIVPVQDPVPELPPEEKAAYIKLASNLSSRIWRLNNLYWIIDAKGRKVKFRLNWARNSS